jgi:hypothetical protein
MINSLVETEFEGKILVINSIVSSPFEWNFDDQTDYQFPICNTKWLKNGKLRKANILSSFYNILQRNFGILLIL